MTREKPVDANAVAQAKRRGRNIALAVALAAWVALMYAITFVKFGAGK
jgi:hypothetical protein